MNFINIKLQKYHKIGLWKSFHSKRDRELFNQGGKSRLFVVYENGKVVLRLWLKKEEYSSQLRLHLEYRDAKSGADFLEANKLKKASASDF